MTRPEPKKKKPRVKITPVRVPKRKALPPVDHAGEHQRAAAAILTSVMDQVEKRPIGLPDPLEAAKEEARCAKEGNLKLAQALETVLETLELIVIAEQDLKTGLPVSAKELREFAVTGLDAYSRLTRQSWRRHKIVHTRAGDRDLTTFE